MTLQVLWPFDDGRDIDVTVLAAPAVLSAVLTHFCSHVF
jgi:hypothetical protein